jgi:hypothetical protein
MWTWFCTERLRHGWLTGKFNVGVQACRDSCQDSEVPSDPDECKDAVNVQIALHELGQDVSIAVAAAVWRHHSNSLMAGWILGAETVASAKIALWAYCMRNPMDFVNASNLRIACLERHFKVPWRVVEVQAISELSLQVRFADGVQGTVKFEPAYLTGVFAALKDPGFFSQVHVASGAVTWPGELDLAPDAMYEEIKVHGEWVPLPNCRPSSNWLLAAWQLTQATWPFLLSRVSLKSARPNVAASVRFSYAFEASAGRSPASFRRIEAMVVTS